MSSQSAVRVDGVENREKVPKRARARVRSRVKTRGRDARNDSRDSFCRS